VQEQLQQEQWELYEELGLERTAGGKLGKKIGDKWGLGDKLSVRPCQALSFQGI
jgi:hypothetical protein